jgi:hypothetical protein
MNMHRLGMGTTGLESYFGRVLNPWNRAYMTPHPDLNPRVQFFNDAPPLGIAVLWWVYDAPVWPGVVIPPL